MFDHERKSEAEKKMRYEAETEPSDARITNQLNFMTEQIGELSSLLHELEERISPILLPSLPQPSDPDVPARATSEVSQIIDDHNSCLTELQRRIKGINQRVQL